MALIRPIILCGGIGARLWPVSREGHPKHLVRFGSELSLLQQTISRCSGKAFSRPLLVAAYAQRDAISEQLLEIDAHPEAIILERVGRNTAPAIALAAEWQAQNDPESLMLVLPSDHEIRDAEAFEYFVSKGVSAARSGKLVAFGIKPRSPETGFGYIRVDDLNPKNPETLDVREFVEKPTLATAKEYLASANYLWNSGIFLFTARTILDELSSHASPVLDWARSAFENGSSEGIFFIPEHVSDRDCPAISIDNAVMERSTNACVVPANLDWSDLGTWNEIWSHSERDTADNAHFGDVVALDVQGSLLIGHDGITVAAVGVQNIVIVATPTGVLVVPRDRCQDVKDVVKALNDRSRISHSDS